MNAYIQYILDILTQGEVCSDWLTNMQPTIAHVMSRLAGCYGTALFWPTVILAVVAVWQIRIAINHRRTT